MRQVVPDTQKNITESGKACGRFVYENGKLSYIINADGVYRAVYNDPQALTMIEPEININLYPGAGEYLKGFTREIHLKDHLGKVRAVFDYSNLQSENHYYPFGLPIHNLCTSTAPEGNENRYLYNGKELQDDLGLNWMDYGARFYDAGIGRWHTIDNKAEKYVSSSPFTYALNNPIIFVDPDGNEVHISITAKAIGTTQIRLIGSENYRGAPRTVEVPVYQMNISDDVTGKTSSYLVTRDGPIMNQSEPVNDNLFSDDTYNVENTAFEPKDAEGNYKAVGLEYPDGMGAYALKNEDGSGNLKAEPNNSPDRKKSNEATGVMIHVGGEYKASDGSQRVTGSLGCFTLAGKDSGNKGAKKLVNDIYGRQQANKKAGKGTDVNVNVQKRKNVDWEWEVDKNGKKTN